jgi:tetratricopeptide (TPR) repeat protein
MCVSFLGTRLGSDFVSSSPPSPRHSRLRLLVALGVVAVGGYFGGTAAWYEWRFRTAVRAERDRNFVVAERELNACLRRRPDDPRAHLLAARLGWRSRVDTLVPGAGWDAPLRRHLKAAEADPLLIERVSREEEIIDALSGRLDAVSGLLARRLKDGDADEVPILEALTWANIVLHQFPAAAEAADGLLARQPDHARGHYWRGLIRELTHYANGLPDSDYRRAVELAPAEFEFRLRLARALAGHPDTRPEALELFERLDADHPHDPEVLAGLGRCRLDLGDVSASLPALWEAVRLRPADGEVMADLGRAVSEAGDPAAAEPVLRRSVALAPNSRLPNYYLGLCLGRLGRGDDARPFLDAATRIYDDTVRVQELSRQLFRNPSAGPEQRVVLGELLCRTGHEDLGEYWLRSALAVDPRYEPARRALAALRSPGR